MLNRALMTPSPWVDSGRHEICLSSVLQPSWSWSSFGLKAPQVYELVSKSSQLGHSISTAPWFLNETYSEQRNLDLFAPIHADQWVTFSCKLFHLPLPPKVQKTISVFVLCALPFDFIYTHDEIQRPSFATLSFVGPPWHQKWSWKADWKAAGKLSPGLNRCLETQA